MTRPGPRANELRLVPAAVAAWIGAGLGVGASAAHPPIPVAVGLWVAAGLAVVSAGLIRAPPARAVIAVLAVGAAAAALVVTSVVVRDPVRSPAELRGLAGTGRAAQLELVVTGSPADGRFRADVVDVTTGGVDRAVSAPVLVFASRGMPHGRLAIGTSLRVTAALQNTEPGDEVAFLLFPRGELVRTGPPPPMLAAADGIRARFAAQSDRLPDPGGDLLPGLAIGDTSRVGVALDTAMKASSLSHLTAVSGANCAVVVGLAMAVTAALGLRRSIRIAASAIVLVAFVVLVTPEPSVLRAAVMAGFVLIALASGRAARGIPLLCMAVVVLLVDRPVAVARLRIRFVGARDRWSPRAHRPVGRVARAMDSLLAGAARRRADGSAARLPTGASDAQPRACRSTASSRTCSPSRPHRSRR